MSVRKFRIVLDGVEHILEVEELDTEPASSQVHPSAPSMPAVQKPAVKKKEAGDVSAPLPGTILDVRVKAGDSVKKGDLLVILEAMKMENEIKAPSDGIVESVEVEKGDTVPMGSLMIKIV